MQRLLIELQPLYATEPVYQVLERVFGEHFRLEQQNVVTIPNRDLSGTSLQSPDDLEATTGKTGQRLPWLCCQPERTCDPENPLQLITKVQVASNATDDSHCWPKRYPI